MKRYKNKILEINIKYSHFIHIFKKIKPEKIYVQFTYYDEKSFEKASFGAKKNDIFKIKNNFYKYDFKEIINSLQNIDYNLIVKEGKRILYQSKV